MILQSSHKSTWCNQASVNGIVTIGRCVRDSCMSSHTKSARSLHVHASFWLLHFAHRTPEERARSLNARNVQTALVTHVFNNPITRTACKSFVRGLPPVCLPTCGPLCVCGEGDRVSDSCLPSSRFALQRPHVLLVTPRSSLVGWVVWIVFLQRRGVCV